MIYHLLNLIMYNPFHLTHVYDDSGPRTLILNQDPVRYLYRCMCSVTWRRAIASVFRRRVICHIVICHDCKICDTNAWRIEPECSFFCWRIWTCWRRHKTSVRSSICMVNESWWNYDLQEHRDTFGNLIHLYVGRTIVVDTQPSF